MPDDLPELTPAEPEGRRDIATLPLIFGTVAVLALAVVLTIAALVAADDDSGGSASAATSAHVSLTEFAITPDAVTVAAGGTIHISNDGTAVHNLAVADTDLKTEDIPAGDTGELDVSSLDPGAYQLLCQIPGHADSGMKASLTVTEGGGGAAAESTDSTEAGSHAGMDYAKMTEDMLASFAAFPAETEGLGNQVLEPTEVKADGTKVFDLTMEAASWERAPGDVVEAMTFNGMVPGPLLDLEVGDRIEVRVQNDLEIATEVHWHGLNTENQYDGVAPLTQDLIEPGESFTYKLALDEPAVAMYHPHAHGSWLLPDGMFGGVIVGDLPLPTGQTAGYEAIPDDITISQRIPMVLNDSGVIGLTLNGKSFPATEPYMAKVGDWVLIDYWNEGNLIHPMHLHQFDQVVVGKDGFPVPEPYAVDTLAVAPGERYTVLVHINKPGVWVWHCHILPHAEREDGSMFGMVTAFIAE